jgi:hypothetical protein
MEYISALFNFQVTCKQVDQANAIGFTVISKKIQKFVLLTHYINDNLEQNNSIIYCGWRDAEMVFT